MSKKKTKKKVTARAKAAKSGKATPAKKAQARKPAAKKAKQAARVSDAKKMSAIDAAAKVLAAAKEPMTTKQMIEAMAAKGYWKSPGGKTPHATLCSAILRETRTKGKDSRFKKTERGKFAANG